MVNNIKYNFFQTRLKVFIDFIVEFNF